MRILSVAVLFLIPFATTAGDVLQGHGDTRWGQTAEEVGQVVTGLELVRGTDDYTVHRAAGAGNVLETGYHFVNDRLLGVKVVFKLPGAPAAGHDNNGLTAIREMLKEKYFADKQTRDTLLEHGITIVARLGGHGTVEVNYENDKIRQEIQAARRAEAATKAAQESEKRVEALKAAGIANEL